MSTSIRLDPSTDRRCGWAPCNTDISNRRPNVVYCTTTCKTQAARHVTLRYTMATRTRVWLTPRPPKEAT